MPSHPRKRGIPRASRRFRPQAGSGFRGLFDEKCPSDQDGESSDQSDAETPSDEGEAQEVSEERSTIDVWRREVGRALPREVLSGSDEGPSEPPDPQDLLLRGEGSPTTPRTAPGARTEFVRLASLRALRRIWHEDGSNRVFDELERHRKSASPQQQVWINLADVFITAYEGPP